MSTERDRAIVRAAIGTSNAPDRVVDAIIAAVDREYPPTLPREVAIDAVLAARRKPNEKPDGPGGRPER